MTDPPLICKHDNCGNICPPERLSTRGTRIQYRQCHTCSNLISNYGIHNGQKKELLALQDNKCAICEKEIVYGNGPTLLGETNGNVAVVDHCHKTGKVRGILCMVCNRALGLFQDSQTILENAKRYLNV